VPEKARAVLSHFDERSQIYEIRAERCTEGFYNLIGQEDYYGHKKIRDSSNRMGYPLKKGRGGKNENILNTKGVF